MQYAEIFRISIVSQVRKLKIWHVNFNDLHFEQIEFQYQLTTKFSRLTVTVFYDNEYKNAYGSRARSHIQNAMGQVEEMYTEFKKWNTAIEIEVKAIKHINEKWVRDSGGRFYKRW